MNLKNKYFNILLISLVISFVLGGSYLLYPKVNNKPKEIARGIKASDNVKKRAGKYYVMAHKQYKKARKNNKNKLYNAINNNEKVNVEKYLTSFCSENELVVKLKPDTDKRIVAERYSGTITNSLHAYNYIVIKLKDGTNKEEVLENMKSDGDIESARACLHYKVQSIPNDTYYNQQWGLQRIQGEISHDVESVSNVKVAVVDTGVDINHPDLQGKLLPGYDVVRRSTKVEDKDGHGTHVAGIISAITNNGIGISGLTTKISILPVGIFHYEGSAGAYMASEDHIAAGIDWARSHGADIINLSLGGGENSHLVEAAVKRAVKAGVTIIAASGNDGYRKINYPAALPDVIAVGATNQSNGLAEFSNYGPEIDIVAPGVEIRSTFPMETGMYLTSSGTSMSAPFVSGLAAMIKAKNPGFTPLQIKKRLQSTATDLGKRGWDTEYGAGLINANEALGGAVVKHPNPFKGDAMEPNNTPTAAKPISYPISITANTFAPTSDVDWFRFKGVKGKSVIIRLKSNLNGTYGANGVLELYRNGNYAVPIKAANNNDNGTEIINFTFPDNGLYYLKVFDFNDNINNTDYALDITSIPLLKSNTQISNKLADLNDIHLYSISAPKLNYINLRLSCGSNFDGVITLYDRNFIPKKQWDNAPIGEDEVVSYKVSSSGTYFIGIQQIGNYNKNLYYALTYLLSPETPTYYSQNINIDDYFVKQYETKYYKIFIDNPGKYQATVKPADGHNLVLQLYRLNNSSRDLVLSSDSGNLGQPDFLACNVITTGTYYLGVYDKKGVKSAFNLKTNFKASTYTRGIKVRPTFYTFR